MAHTQAHLVLLAIIVVPEVHLRTTHALSALVDQFVLVLDSPRLILFVPQDTFAFLGPLLPLHHLGSVQKALGAAQTPLPQRSVQLVGIKTKQVRLLLTA